MYLDNAIKRELSDSLPVFDQIMGLRGECFRDQDGRVTQRVLLGGKSYFIKQHFGVGWKEIFKNLLQFRWPVLGAKNEWRAIRKLQALGVNVPVIVGYGQRGLNPARRQSFILMEELAPVESLETFCRDWSRSAPDFRLKRYLIEQVAGIARALHLNGMNHRDFYICHFLMKTDHRQEKSRHQPALCLIDLHRAEIRGRVPERWIIKDLSGLYFSSKDIGLTQRDLCRFIKIYTGRPLRDAWYSNKFFWQKVRRRGEQLYRDHSQR